MNEHAKFLREESDAAMADDCPVASNGLKRAADEIERLTTEVSGLKERLETEYRRGDKNAQDAVHAQLDVNSLTAEGAKMRTAILDLKDYWYADPDQSTWGGAMPRLFETVSGRRKDISEVAAERAGVDLSMVREACADSRKDDPRPVWQRNIEGIHDECAKLIPADPRRKFEHLPGCAHVQNMARPRSQQLIGPKCTCAETYRRKKDLEEWLKSDDGKNAIAEIAADSRLCPWCDKDMGKGLHNCSSWPAVEKGQTE